MSLGRFPPSTPAILAAFVLSSLAAAHVGSSTQTPTSGADDASLRIVRLETNAAANPLGIDTRHPRFSWALESTRRGVMQTRSRVLVASRPDLLRPGTADVWDSGDAASSDPFVVYGGAALTSRTRYFWSVRVEAAPGLQSEWAAAAWFETAILDPAEWREQWIAGPERGGILTPEQGAADDGVIRAAGEFCRPVQWLTSGFAAARVKNNQGECREVRPVPMLRKAFRLTKPVARARVYSSGLAYNDLTINGRPASDSLLDPAFTDYGRTVLYTTHDITSLLRTGENIIATELGSGHFDDATRTWDWGWEQAEWRGTPRLRLDLWLTYEDGSEEVVASDTSWKMSIGGPTRYDSLYLGETYDARREISGWREPGFDDTSWSTARTVPAPAGTPRAQPQEPIRVVAEREPGTRREPAPGVIVYDIGQHLTGWAEIAVQAPAGTPVQVFYTEKVDEAGRGSTAGNDLVFGQLQTDFYIARGGGREVWRPKFSYKGFRYVQISGPDGAPLPSTAKVEATRVLQVRTALERTSTFESSSVVLDNIHRNTVWAIQNNVHGVITDTPVYEKNGWTGDAALTAGTASILFDTERLYSKLSIDMRDAQTERGEVPLLAPSNENYGYVGKPAFKPVDCCGATPIWDAFWFVIPRESYLRFGDRASLERAYPAMQKYLDEWIPQWTGKDGDTYAHTLTAGLGDWVPPEGVPTVNALSSTAYYAHLAAIAAATARALGRAQDADRYEGLAARIRADFNARFLGSDGVYREKPEEGFVQTSQILPLAFDLVPEPQREGVASRLAQDVAGPRDGNPWVGVIGARHILPVLSKTGHFDAACATATQTDEPSWGYWTEVAKFTSLGEHWSATTRSRNHHFFGAIVEWMYEDLAGMRPIAPGYARIAFDPAPASCAIDRVSASYESVRGTVGIEWRRTASGLDLEVTVPPNATGRVYVPAPSAEAVTEISGPAPVPAGRAEGVTVAGRERDRVLLDVGSGRYRFRVVR